MTEHLRVQAHRSRARAVGSSASLSLEQWEQTLADFEGLCAYCLTRPFDVLEHFIPIALAGTTVNNCLPACHKCNMKKGNATGQDLISLFGHTTIERIQRYLASRSNGHFDHPIRYQPAPRVLREKSIYTIQELFEANRDTAWDSVKISHPLPHCGCVGFQASEIKEGRLK